MQIAAILKSSVLEGRVLRKPKTWFRYGSRSCSFFLWKTASMRIFFHQFQKYQLIVCYIPLNLSIHSLRVHLWSVQTHLKSGQAQKALKEEKRSHGQEAKVLKCLIMNIVIIFQRTDSFFHLRINRSLS